MNFVKFLRTPFLQNNSCFSIMVLTRSQYENMIKDELIQELTDINSSFVYNIDTKLADSSEKLNELT